MHAEETLPLKPTRASFIRGLPESMPIDEVIERGREVGLSINPSDVHSVRYYMRQEAAQAGPPKPTPSSPPPVADVAATVRRNYSLLEAQRAPLESQSDDAKRGTRKERDKPRRKPTATVEATAAMEGPFREIVMRIGTDRAREIIAEIERLKVED
ncbi:MAG TPA: hypothetical protein VJR89_26140 [Polyangiales bacterium]|nr:hypothetical protein [Polyangiales bacterium]